MIRVLSEQQCVLTAREIADALRNSGSDVGIATVYRALELLDELGLVHRLDTREGSTRYRPIRPGSITITSSATAAAVSASSRTPSWSAQSMR